MFFKIAVLKHFAMLTWKHLCWSLDVSFLINVVGLKACNFIKKRLQHRFFLINIAKFLRTVFLQNTSGGCFYTHGWVAFANDYHELKLFKFNLQFKYCYPEVQKTSSSIKITTTSACFEIHSELTTLRLNFCESNPQ